MRTDIKFKKKIQNLRQQAGITQKELAEKIGVSELAYQRYECGDRAPNVRTAIRIAHLLGTTVENLWFPSPEFFPSPDGD